MSKDDNKGITEIQYNSLNLPRQMVINSASVKAKNYYTYSASGVKLKTEQRYDPALLNSPIGTTTPATDGLTDYKNTDYAGNIIYETMKSGSTTTNKTRILVDGGYIENNAYYFYLNDHLGNNRVLTNASGTVTQKNHYYPSGTTFAESTSADAQPYKYNGKELDKMHGLNLYDYSARYYESAIGRFTTIDPLAEKYYSISPYVYCSNNPLKYIDLRGDSISVAEKYRDRFNDSLEDVFGDNANNFSYNENGILVYNGSTDGFSKDQKKVFKELSKIMKETTVTEIIYDSSVQITDANGNQVTVKGSIAGGSIAILAKENPNMSKNIVLVDPKTYTTQTTFAIKGTGYEKVSFITNMTDLVFHELGHVRYVGQTQDKVIKFNNSVRKIINLPKRPYDQTHNYNVKNGIYN